MQRLPTCQKCGTLVMAMGVFLATAVCVSHGLGDEPSVDFKKDVLPILRTRCFDCHGVDEQNGDVQLDGLSHDLVRDRTGTDTWHDALHALHRGDMPPEDATELSPEERKSLTDWITGELERAERARRSTGGQVVMRRLNRLEYQNTMHDLLGVELNYSRDLPPDPISGDGFTNNGASLRMSAMQLESYLASARDGFARAIVSGPEPTVHEHQSDKSVNDKGKGNWTDRLGRTGTFVARVPEFPDEGEFVIRIRARAERPANSPFGIMQVTLGYRADVSAPSRVVGTVDVSNEQTQEFEFRGRFEEFPIQTRTQSKYPGMLIWVRNVYSDGQPPPKPKTVVEVDPDAKGKRAKKKKKKTVYVEDPEFPKVIIESLEFKAPVFSRWPPKHHRQLIVRQPDDNHDERSVARASLSRFLRRALRREIGEADVSRFLDYFDTIRPDSETFEAAMREVMSMALISPEFLYLSEPQASGRELSDHELATRLSYFLWSSMPDQQLFEVASQGELSEPRVLIEQVDRMLDDDRSETFAQQFADQWLDLGGVDRVAVNPEFYPDFDNAIKEDMRREPQHLFAEVLRQDLSALRLLDAKFLVVNQKLAEHYGIDGPRGSEFERVDLPDGDVRGGLLTQAAVLLANSTGEDSHPIKRAVWIRDRLLNDPPAPPPPDVPDLNQELPDLAALPLKAQLDQHRENASCAACHRDLDPWGVTLEEFDAIGLRRDVIRRPHPKRREKFVEHPVDAVGVLPDGSHVEGAVALKAYLTDQKSEAFSRALVTKMLAYATGRSPEFGDDAVINELTDRFIRSDYKLKELIRMIVASDSFRQG